MTDNLRKQIESILQDRIVDITDEYLGQKRAEGIQVYLGYPQALVDQLLALFEKEFLEMVGEDEYNPFDIDKDDQGGIDWEEAVDLDTRNQLRKELREEIKK